MVTCKLCGITGKRLATHLCNIHKMNANTYRELFPKAEIDCKETIQKMSNSRKGMVFSLEHIKNLSISHKGFKPTEETRRKLSIASKNSINKGRFKKGNVPPNKGKNKDNCEAMMRTSIKLKGRITSPNSNSKEANEKRSISLKKAYAEGRKQVVRAYGNGYAKGNIPWNKGIKGYKLPQNSVYMKNYWANEDNVRVMTENRIKGQRIGPNKAEIKLMSLLDAHFKGEWVFNKSKIIIDKKIPDFVNINGKKKLIELQGCYHHGCPICKRSTKHNNFIQKALIYKNYGFDTLEIWEHELSDEIELLKKIKEFNK
jgi:hypothetical protein